MICQQLDDTEIMDKFLEIYDLPRVNHDERENLNRPTVSKETVIKDLLTWKCPGSDGHG